MSAIRSRQRLDCREPRLGCHPQRRRPSPPLYPAVRLGAVPPRIRDKLPIPTLESLSSSFSLECSHRKDMHFCFIVWPELDGPCLRRWPLGRRFNMRRPSPCHPSAVRDEANLPGDWTTVTTNRLLVGMGLLE